MGSAQLPGVVPSPFEGSMEMPTHSISSCHPQGP